MREVTAKKVILKDLQNNYVIPYTPLVTQTNDGLMSIADKIKLDNLSEGSGSGEDLIDDSIISETKTYSSKKIEDSLATKLTTQNLIAGDNIDISVSENNVIISATGSGGSSGGEINLTNYYTKAQSNALFASKASEHVHANKETILDLFTLDDAGILKWNGKALPTNPKQISIVNNEHYDIETEIFNLKTISNENNFSSLTALYLFISNKATITPGIGEDEEDPNTATITIYNNNIKLDTIILKPTLTQGYQLPAIIGLSIRVKGTVYSELSITGYGN